jgi:hypothetical protein
MVAVDLGGQDRAFLQQRFGFLGIVPEAVFGDDGLELLEALFLGSEVKDSPLSGGGGRGFPGGIV